MSKILRVNMTDLTATYEDVPEKYRLLGGRGLTSTIVADEVEPTCHPLGPHNKVVFAPGLVSGTAAPNSGRLSVGAKSPLTGGIKESNAGGISSQKIAHLGIKAMVVEGQPREKQLYALRVSKAGAELVPVPEIAGKGMYETNATLWARYGRVAIVGIGLAGERLMTNAGVSTNDMENGPGRYASRGGLGAAMGSKGLKAIAVDDAGVRDVPIKDPEAFRVAAKQLTDALREHPVTSQTLPSYGTAVLINVLSEAGGLPTRNFSSGRFEGAAKTSGEAIAGLVKARGGVGRMGHPCHPGCVIQCSNVVPREDGTLACAPVDYEPDWALGANCGIDSLDDIATMNYLCDDFGVDAVETGVALGVAMEAGLLKFGDGKAAIELLEEVGNGTPLGRILGQGAAFTARAFGVTRVPVVKGQGMPAYEPRAVKGIGTTYVTLPMGADHTAGYAVATEILSVGGKADPLSPAGKAELSRDFQVATAFLDSTGYCLFISFATLDIPSGFEGMLGTINAMYGTSWTAEDITRIGQEVLRTERRFNELAGFSKGMDRVPEFMKHEPLPPHNTVFDVPDEELDRVLAF